MEIRISHRSQEVKPASENINDDMCANHEDCGVRPSQIKLAKGFTAKEHAKGHTVNLFLRHHNLYS
jgi:hypothetical protein